jgi:glycosyltransferase involved in cell wall biosynthesis
MKVIPPDNAASHSDTPNKKKILYVFNVSWFFISHRLQLACAVRDAGYEVHVAASPFGDDATVINAKGLVFHPIAISRSKTRIFSEIESLKDLATLYRRICPDLIEHATIKPVLYGGIVARLAKIPFVVNWMTGLGYVFISQGLRSRLRRAFVEAWYRVVLNFCGRSVIFENPDDRNFFLERKIISKGSAKIIRGGGVDTQAFSITNEPIGSPLVVLVSRMLWDKGVGEFVESARLLKARGVVASFVLVGDTDIHNPAAIAAEQLTAWRAEGIIEWWGRRDDIPSVLALSHIVCLPSYREGLPKALLEAASCGRPIVTTDTNGCREIVRHGENGFLVPVRSTIELADALQLLIENPELRKKMGSRGREIVMSEFAVEKVISETMAVYEELLKQ